MRLKMKEVRNKNGTLLFKAVQLDGGWYVQVKNHGVYTLVRLQPDGKLRTKDYEQEVRS